jgi:hypothetical protein
MALAIDSSTPASVSGVNEMASVRKASATPTSGTVVTFNFDHAGSAAVDTNWAAAEILPASATSNIPQNLVATTVDDDSIDLDWDAVTGADAYVVERDDSPWVVLADNVLTNSYTDSGLDPSTEYTYRVRSVF